MSEVEGNAAGGSAGAAADACIPNIGPRERRRRLQAGMVGLAVALMGLAVLMIVGVGRVWRLVLVVPFWAAALGVFQARDKT